MPGIFIFPIAFHMNWENARVISNMKTQCREIMKNNGTLNQVLHFYPSISLSFLK